MAKLKSPSELSVEEIKKKIAELGYAGLFIYIPKKPSKAVISNHPPEVVFWMGVLAGKGISGRTISIPLIIDEKFKKTLVEEVLAIMIKKIILKESPVGRINWLSVLKDDIKELALKYDVSEQTIIDIVKMGRRKIYYFFRKIGKKKEEEK